MKLFSTSVILAFAIIVPVTSCTKYKLPVVPKSGRTITFTLHTEKDFSHDNHNITFSLFIRTHTQVLFDSLLPVMKIKDIPDSMHKLLYQKKLTNDDGSDLGVGFRYAIENVGTSSFVDSSKAGESFKTVDFSFK
jgi:hypothetical protein